MTLSKQQIAHQFSRAASTYDGAAPLQRAMAEELIGSIPANATGTLVDMGCGTGWAIEQIAKRNQFKSSEFKSSEFKSSEFKSSEFKSSEFNSIEFNSIEFNSIEFNLNGVDLAPMMIASAKKRVPDARLYCCDLEATPFSDNSVDLVFSNAAIQWCDTTAAISEMFRVCKTGGILRLSTFCPGTLREIQSAWEESGDAENRVHRFESAETLEIILANAGFCNVDCRVHKTIQTFDTVDNLLASVKRLGATNASSSRRGGLLGAGRYRKFRAVLEKRLANDGRLELTYVYAIVLSDK